MDWAGQQADAVLVVAELVENVVDHVGPYGDGEVRLALTITDEEVLLIDVTDPDPEFDGFHEAVSVQKATGLGLVRELGADISWSAPEDVEEKTVRVRMPSLRSP
ncbi:hypothetical protein OK074_5140 [Actinobacteria bacterium OK074]|nr:hypothetical protein OK074_5140 [Actinobacteria bacterium OK074]